MNKLLPLLLLSGAVASTVSAATLRQDRQGRDNSGGTVASEKRVTTIALLQNLANKHKVAFVIEGDLMATQFAQKVRHSLPDAQISLDKQVDAAALACDYDAKFSGSMFVWTRRYHDDPDAVPDISLDEAITTTDRLKKIVNPFRPVFPINERLGVGTFTREYLLSLTPEQRKVLAQKKMDDNEGEKAPYYAALQVNVRDLPSHQRNILWQFALAMYVENRFSTLDQLSRKLKNIKVEETDFFIATRKAGHFLGLKNEPRDAVKQQLVLFGDPYRVSIHRESFATNTSDRSTQKDRTAPDPPTSGTIPLGTSQRIPPNDLAPLSIKETLTLFNQVSVEVDPSIAEKRVTIVMPEGGQFKDLEEALPSGIAAVYGLDIIPRDDRKVLTLKSFPSTTKNIRLLPGMILEVLPQPMIRAMSGVIKQKLEEKKSPLSIPFGPGRARDKSMEAIRIRATKQLRTIVEPKIKESALGKVPMSALTSNEKHLTATVLLAVYLPHIGKFVDSEQSLYISRFDDMVITCTASLPSQGGVRVSGQGDKPVYTLSLCINNNGNLSPLISSALYQFDLP